MAMNNNNVKVIGSNEADGWENPYSTPQGQIEVGQSEALYQYYVRKGLLREKSVYDIAVTQGAFSTVLVTTAAPVGKRQDALFVSGGSDGPGLWNVEYKKQDGTSRYIWLGYLAANASIAVDLKGAAWSGEGLTLVVNCRPVNTGTKAAATLLYAEV